jgi:cell division septum initiation protein DivIVA
MKLNKTREQWLEHRNGNQTGRDDFYDCVWDVIRLYDEVSQLKKENFELRDAVESYKIAEASLRKQIKDKEQEWLKRLLRGSM